MAQRDVKDVNTTHNRSHWEPEFLFKSLIWGLSSQSGDFFPVLGRMAQSITNKGSMAGVVGFRTTLYFKNPGFKTGDTLVIKVRDKKNPELVGAVAVELK
jgi:hypothetical protein